MGKPMGALDFEADPLAAMRAMTDWHRVEIIIDSTDDWQSILYQINRELQKVVEGRYWSLMANEDAMTDEQKFYVIRCEDRSDAEKVERFYPKSWLAPPPPPRVDPGPAPAWLKNAKFRA